MVKLSPSIKKWTVSGKMKKNTCWVSCVIFAFFTSLALYCSPARKSSRPWWNCFAAPQALFLPLGIQAMFWLVFLVRWVDSLWFSWRASSTMSLAKGSSGMMTGITTPSHRLRQCPWGLLFWVLLSPSLSLHEQDTLCCLSKVDWWFVVPRAGCGWSVGWLPWHRSLIFHVVGESLQGCNRFHLESMR